MRVLLAIVVILSAFVSPSISLAGGTTISPKEAITKINLSGRQRMLSQRLAKAVCFMVLEVDVDRHQDQLETAQTLFGGTLLDLYSGDPAVGLTPETSEVIKDRLAEVSVLWTMMDMTMTYIGVAGKGQPGELDSLSALSLLVLADANQAVQAFEAEYAKGAIDPTLAKTINVAGRQRMLSQRMAKESCLIAAGINSDQNRDKLESSMKLFETSLKALRSGDDAAGIVAPLTEVQSNQLLEVEQIWQGLEAQLIRVLQEDVVPLEALSVIATLNDPLLVEMNKVVGMY